MKIVYEEIDEMKRKDALGVYSGRVAPISYLFQIFIGEFEGECCHSFKAKNIPDGYEKSVEWINENYLIIRRKTR